MGFFFSSKQRGPRVAKKVVRKGPVKPTARALQSAPTLHRLGCKACPLNNTGDRYEPKIKEGRPILFLGGTPNVYDEKLKLFSGPDGEILKELVPRKYAKKANYVTTVQHELTDGRDSPTWQEIECCRGYVTKAIEKARPRLIVGLGVDALEWVLGNRDEIGLRGRLFAVKIGEHKCWFIPTYSPAFVRKMSYDDSKPLASRFGHAIRMDFDNIFDRLEAGLGKPKVITPEQAKKGIDIFYGQDEKSFDLLMDHFDDALKYAKVLATDLEGYPLKPYHNDSVLLTNSISYRRKGKLKTFAFSVHHPKQKWSPSQVKKIKSKWAKLFSKKDIVKVGHNTPFELEWLVGELGEGIIDHNSWADTMLQAHLLDERKGAGKDEEKRPSYQSLDFLINLHFGLKVKSLFNLNKKDMRTSPIVDCLVYNGSDTKHTLLLYERQADLLEEEGLLEMYEMAKPRQTTVALMQRLGVEVDQKVNRKLGNRLLKEVREIEAEIKEMKVVKKYVKDNGSFNPHSPDEVVPIFRDYLKRKEVEADGRVSVDKNVLEKIDHPLAPAIIKLRNRSKLKSTYVDEFTLGSGKIIFPDGKIHTTYNTTFTTSGRLSSEWPNLQNFPKRNDAEVREQVKPPKGYVVVSIDYGQLEWCLACICSQDKAMIDATWKGYDVHMEWAHKIAKQWPGLVGGKKNIKDPKKMKFARGLVKNKMVFPVIFGAREESVAGYLDMPDDVSKRIFAEFWKTFGGLAVWQKTLMRNYYDLGYVENLFGRRRRYPLTKNEAVNFPIQSTASDMVVDAMTRLSKLAHETDMILHPRLNIHDDLTFFLPDNSQVIDDCLEIIIGEMLKLPYSFINVPMSVEVSIGPDWFHQEEIGKFWSTDIYGKKHEEHHWSRK